METYPWTTEAAESMWVGVIPIVQLDVVITTVGLLLYLKSDEGELDAVALFSRQQPLTVGVTRVIIVSKLGVRVEVLLTSFCFQTTSTLCKELRKSELADRVRFYEWFPSCTCCCEPLEGDVALKKLFQLKEPELVTVSDAVKTHTVLNIKSDLISNA